MFKKKTSYPKIIINNVIRITKGILGQGLETKPLGRWSLLYDKRLDSKIDRANEDHCGPCGELYLKEKNNSPKNKIN